ncbi:hypothetical protein A3K81_04705 [Candidatus Bathyarchaeota archaeon RBG_13_60_20]|nr:MAG: hypothetical protein A3K81_04705 [Candidatus Bathyarchaeota archaeon RBG_13_60_20]
MAKTREDMVEDAVIQAVGHYERRNIIKIIGAAPGGVTYTEILGLTGLNTGHLNYHLRGLEGLVERDEARLYRLTPLGLKALRLLAAIGEDIGNGDMPYIDTVLTAQSSLLSPLVRGFMNVMILVSLFGTLGGLWLLGDGYLYGMTGRMIGGMVIALICGVLLYSLLSNYRTAPDYFRRWEKRVLK